MDSGSRLASGYATSHHHSESRNQTGGGSHVDNPDPNPPKAKGPGLLTTVKEGLNVVRDSAILLVLLALLVWPAGLNNRLQRAGFTKADIAGFHWEKAQEAAEATGRATQQIDAVLQRVDSVRRELRVLASRASETSIKLAINQFATVLDSSTQVARATQSDLASSLKAQEVVLNELTPAADKNSGTWAVVISADKDLEPAQFEVNRAKKLGFPSPSIFQRGAWLRTAIEYSSRQTAEDALPGVRRSIRDSAYIVRLDDWCKDPKTTQQPGMFRCAE